jgi:hypothetical protein
MSYKLSRFQALEILAQLCLKNKDWPLKGSLELKIVSLAFLSHYSVSSN